MGTGERKRLGKPRLYCSLDPSPDGLFMLVAWLARPFSYNVPCGRFPKRVQLWDRCVSRWHPALRSSVQQLTRLFAGLRQGRQHSFQHC